MPDSAADIIEEVVEDSEDPGGHVENCEDEEYANDPGFIACQVGGEDRVPRHGGR